jgi:ribosomal protein S18 acetylase RimI-like enzyme
MISLIDKSMKVKRVTSADWQEYKKIRLEALKNEPQAFGSSYNRESERTESEWQNKLAKSEDLNGTSFSYAALREGVFVAIGGAYQDNNKQWNIIAVYTKKEFRGQGLGQKVFESIINELKARKIKKAYLCVNTLQVAAQALYKKNGFVVKRIIKDQLLGDGKYYDEVEMFIDL